jgi:hypothetical protein
MEDVLLTVRLPAATRRLLHAAASVTGLHLRTIVMRGFEKLFEQLPSAIQTQVNDIAGVRLGHQRRQRRGNGH